MSEQLEEKIREIEQEYNRQLENAQPADMDYETWKKGKDAREKARQERANRNGACEGGRFGVSDPDNPGPGQPGYHYPPPHPKRESLPPVPPTDPRGGISGKDAIHIGIGIGVGGAFGTVPVPPFPGVLVPNPHGKNGYIMH